MAISPVARGISHAISSLPKTKPIQKLGNWFNKDFENALALSTIASICLKDGVGCAMYVYQSTHNEKIPEKRRKFVSALDLTNGILMIASQIGMFFAMRKFNEKIFNAIFKKSFNENMFKHLKELIRVEQKAAGKVPDSTFKIRRDFNDIKNSKGLSVFKVVTELFAATIFGKRVIVPFIALCRGKPNRQKKKMTPLLLLCRHRHLCRRYQTIQAAQISLRNTENKIKTPEQSGVFLTFNMFAAIR